MGQDSQILINIRLKIRRQDDLESSTNLEVGEFKFSFDSCIKYTKAWSPVKIAHLAQEQHQGKWLEVVKQPLTITLVRGDEATSGVQVAVSPVGVQWEEPLGRGEGQSPLKLTPFKC